jgi:hypothetical protein
LTSLADYVYSDPMQSTRQHIFFLAMVCSLLISITTAAYSYNISTYYNDFSKVTACIEKDLLAEKQQIHTDELCTELIFEPLLQAPHLPSLNTYFVQPENRTLTLPTVFFDIFVPPQNHQGLTYTFKFL